MTAQYDLGGNMTSLTYPDGQVMNYSYDSASRVTAIADSANNNYANGTNYYPSGAISSFNSPVVFRAFGLNNRLQPSWIYSNNSIHEFIYKSYSYGAQGANNGNVVSITNNNDGSRSQSFAYDALNRLIHAETAGANCAAPLPDGHNEYWGNNYVYDALGQSAAEKRHQMRGGDAQRRRPHEQSPLQLQLRRCRQHAV